ncbi:MAG TPA: Gfo/Idh/MocA family oxidoreductase [Methylomirabilota bacterium]|nr:Gfo/Idh/MocA family oxidoreductase [Methylomirabilota bacterium]
MKLVNSSSHSPFTRRNFLKSTGAALVGALPIGRFAHAAGGDTLRLALVGCGGRGTGAANQAMVADAGLKLWAMCDVQEDKLLGSLSSLRKQHPERVDVPYERQFTGFDGYKKAIAESDAVILATSPGFRPAHFAEAVRQGKHVFMEKPVATDAPGVRRVLAAAEEAKKKGLKVAVGLQRRHQPSYIETVKRLQDGAIGEIHTMRAYWLGNARGGLERNPGETEMHYQIRNWYYFTWLSGDHNVEQHIHNIDVINWIKNAFPIRAQGMGGRQVRNEKIHGQIFDHHFVEYEYADGSRMFSQCRQGQRGAHSQVSEHVQGALGAADLGIQGRLFQITGPRAWRLRLDKGEDGHQLEHYPWLEAIRKNMPYNEAEFGAKSTMTAIMGRMATYSGKVVEWEDAFNSRLQLVPDGPLDWNSVPPVVPDKDGWYPVAVPGQTVAW